MDHIGNGALNIQGWNHDNTFFDFLFLIMYNYERYYGPSTVFGIKYYVQNIFIGLGDAWYRIGIGKVRRTGRKANQQWRGQSLSYLNTNIFYHWTRTYSIHTMRSKYLLT